MRFKPEILGFFRPVLGGPPERTGRALQQETFAL